MLCSLTRLHKVIIGTLSIFLLYFPKGGIKIQSLPITWGYLLLFTTFIGALLLRPPIVERGALYCLLALIPFQLVSCITFGMSGVLYRADMFSYWIHFFIMPIGFLGILPRYIDRSALRYLFEWIRRGMLFIALYGIFLFGYKMITGSFLEIPFLTVNYHDLHELGDTKCNDRGIFFKLISTYNNGNLYGICVLMLLPLYGLLENKKWKLWTVKGSLILTLSRTIWLGLIAYEILKVFVIQEGFLKKMVRVLVSLGVLALGFMILLQYIPFSSDFLFDRFLGNRIGQLEVLKHIEWFSSQPFQGVYEVIYLGILYSFGIVGLITFLFAMLFPLGLYVVQPKGSKEGAHLALGLFLYLLTACSDGALLLIPVMCFYFLQVMLLVSSMREVKSYDVTHSG